MLSDKSISFSNLNICSGLLRCGHVADSMYNFLCAYIWYNLKQCAIITYTYA